MVIRNQDLEKKKKETKIWVCSLLLGCHCSQDLLGGNKLIQIYAHICNYFCMYPSVSIGKHEPIVMSPTLIQYHMIYSGLFLLFIITLSLVASLVAQAVKRLPAMRETGVWFLSWEDPLEKEMATHSSTLACKIPWTEEPGRLQSMVLQRVGHDWGTSHGHSHTLSNSDKYSSHYH